MSKLLFLPIDTNIKLDKEEILSNFSPEQNFHVWNFEKLVEDNVRYGINSFTKEAEKKYPSIVKFVNSLPFTDISNVKINIQTEQSAMHIDFQRPENGKELYDNVSSNEPSGYRVLIQGSREKLYVQTDTGKHLARLPEDTNVYVLSQTECLHQVEEDTNRMILYVTGFVNTEKHQALLEKSLKKYNEYAIYG